MLTKKHIICKRVLMTNLMFTDGLTSGIIFQLFITKNDDFFRTTARFYQY
jgi:hypothetical protein